MSKGEQPRALRQSLQKSFATRWTPREGGLFFWRFQSCPLSQKPVQKWFLPPKRG
jgi:hypothetical protein